MKRTLLFILLLLPGSFTVGGDVPPGTTKRIPAFLDRPTPWADSVLTTLDLDQRIAQLMMVAAYSNKEEAHAAGIEQLIRDYNIGGLIFFQGGPARQAILTNRFQQAARTPLLIGMDLEWGLNMRLDSTMAFPKQMTLGAIADEAGLEQMGAEIARQMKRLGVHVSFSPVVDVNVEPNNPVINERSFGEDPERVARKGSAYMRGLQKEGVLASAKHFPGHGDTHQDSHKTLPTVAASRSRIDSVELVPFQQLIDQGVAATMVAHLNVPELDPNPGPSTMSKAIVTDLLQEQMGFRGLVFTDALNMRGVADAAKPGEIELRALLAGNDVLLFPQDPVKAIEFIRKAVDEGVVSEDLIEEKCHKVLKAKEWAGLGQWQPIKLGGLYEDLNTPGAEALRRSLYAQALTVVRNDGLLPIRNVDSLKIASLAIGGPLENDFQEALGKYAQVAQIRAAKILNDSQSKALLDSLKQFDLVIASVHGTTFRANKEFGVPQLTLDFLRRLANQQPMAFVLFANPYRLGTAFGAQRWNGLVVAYEENEVTQDLAAQLLFGAIPARATLPVTASEYFSAGQGIQLASIGRLRYGLPEEEGMDTGELLRIDSIVLQGLLQEAYPGCQLLVAKNGCVVWDKTYGAPSFTGERHVNEEDIYDLASITKVAATTLALMKLVDQGLVKVEDTLGAYLPELLANHPEHASLTLSEVLAHQAGFRAWAPFHERLVGKGEWRQGVMAGTADDQHDMRVAEGIFISRAYRDSVIKWVLETPLKGRGTYRYSDMGMYLLMKVVEKASGTGFERFLQEEFYRPLGLATMGFNPLERFPITRIMPTENDTEFRKQLLRGDVHDQGAALMGGVAGHAGLFSNANDLAVIMQMLLNGGEYGGKRYLSQETVALFTACRYCTGNRKTENRRALGWDRPQAPGTPGPSADQASTTSFGHTGFTGTMVWADPANGTVYVFLSNRVYPDATNKRLSSLNIRTRVQSIIAQAAEWPVAHAEPLLSREKEH